MVCLLLTQQDHGEAQPELLAAVVEAFADPATHRRAVEAKNYTEFKAALVTGGADGHG